MQRAVFCAAMLLCGAAEAATIAVNVDTTQDRRAIDPQIYGVNFGTAAQLAEPGFTVRRWGGNHTSRYNYTTDVSNRGFDYVFLNVDQGGVAPPAQSSLNNFIAETLGAGRTPLVTIGTIGWRPLDNVRAKRYGFSVFKYGPQLATGDAPWDLEGGNGRCDSTVNTTIYCPDRPGEEFDLIVLNQPTDTSSMSDPGWASGWINHLKQRHADSVHHYALDNEPMLWNSTHRDVHPQPVTYDELWTQRTVPYATAIKNADPQAQVFGPVTWGYCDLFSSAADGCHVGADRNAHGGLPFVQWYLRQICANPVGGKRLVDYLDLHYYPQGEIAENVGVVDFGDGANDAVTAELRLRSLKELYDPDWVAESWFSHLGDEAPYHYAKPQIIRRVKAWIAAECPGTKLAITEYQWGSDHGASSALAQAEVLAIFGREGVDFATRWVAPAPGSRVERAFRLFLNYDGNGSRVEGDSVRASSADVDALGAYAVDIPNQRTMVLLFNKATAANTAQISLNGVHQGEWRLYRFDADIDVTQVGSGNIAGSTLTLADLPARSANLLVLPAGSGVSTRVFANGFE